ncbi:MAG: hypothetical protein NTY48_04030 [Candidatus Diapherotrites archaeon]|nr:hypothetical protein [Candidatus Diapherotrites archaeon]
MEKIIMKKLIKYLSFFILAVSFAALLTNANAYPVDHPSTCSLFPSSCGGGHYPPDMPVFFCGHYPGGGDGGYWFGFQDWNTGPFKITTVTSSMDPRLYVYTGPGTDLLSLVPVGFDDNCAPDDRNSTVVLTNTSPGTIYWIEIERASGTYIETDLNFIAEQIPPGTQGSWCDLNANPGGPYKGMKNSAIQLNGSPSGGIPPYKFRWATTSPDCTFSDANIQNPTFTCPSDGDKNIQLVVGDNACFLRTDLKNTIVDVNSVALCSDLNVLINDLSYGLNSSNGFLSANLSITNNSGRMFMGDPSAIILITGPLGVWQKLGTTSTTIDPSYMWFSMNKISCKDANGDVIWHPLISADINIGAFCHKTAVASVPTDSNWMISYDNPNYEILKTTFTGWKTVDNVMQPFFTTNIPALTNGASTSINTMKWIVSKDLTKIPQNKFKASIICGSSPPNNTPVFYDFNLLATMNSPTATELLDKYVIDENPQTATYSIISQDANQINCSINGKNLVYTPVTNTVGNAKCRIRVTDDSGLTNDANIIIKVTTNPTCTITPANATINRGTNYDFNIKFSNFSITPTATNISALCSGTIPTTTDCNATQCKITCINNQLSGILDANITKNAEKANCSANIFVRIDVNAGPDKTTFVTQQVTLDGNVNGGTLPYNYTWNLITPDGSCSIDNIHLLKPLFTCSTTGIRTLRLTATDSNTIPQTKTDDTLITFNTPSTSLLDANAGPDKNILIDTYAQLDGSATGGTTPFTYTWSLSTPDITCSIDNIHAQKPNFKCTTPGIRTITLTVTDNTSTTTQTDNDHMDINVYSTTTTPNTTILNSIIDLQANIIDNNSMQVTLQCTQDLQAQLTITNTKTHTIINNDPPQMPCTKNPTTAILKTNSPLPQKTNIQILASIKTNTPDCKICTKEIFITNKTDDKDQPTNVPDNNFPLTLIILAAAIGIITKTKITKK